MAQPVFMKLPSTVLTAMVSNAVYSITVISVNALTLLIFMPTFSGLWDHLQWPLS